MRTITLLNHYVVEGLVPASAVEGHMYGQRPLPIEEVRIYGVGDLRYIVEVVWRSGDVDEPGRPICRADADWRRYDGNDPTWTVDPDPRAGWHSTPVRACRDGRVIDLDHQLEAAILSNAAGHEDPAM